MWVFFCFLLLLLFFSQPLILGCNKGRVGQTGVARGESQVGCMEERCGGMAMGFSVPGFPQQPPFLTRAGPSQGKSIYLTLWDTAPPYLWNTACSTLHHFFSFSCFVLFFVLFSLGYFSFFSSFSFPILHLNSC